MNRPLVSIIMPTYNRRNVIGDAIDSCLTQTYTNIEIVICDDHSTDDTKDYIKKRMEEDARIRFCENPDGKKGANAARNTAIMAARGSLIVFLDTDDYLLPDSIEIRVNMFKENPYVAMVYGNIIRECDGRRGEWIYCDLEKEKLNQRIHLMQNLALCCQLSLMFRKSILCQIGLLDETQKGWTDDGLVVAIGMKYRIKHCRKFVGVARKSDVCMTGNKWNMYEGCKIMVGKYKRQIIKYASFRRYVLWKIRLISAYCYAREVECNRKLQKEIWRFFHEKIRDIIKPYFYIYCE